MRDRVSGVAVEEEETEWDEAGGRARAAVGTT